MHCKSTPSRQNALAQLERFMPSAGERYAKGRNFDLDDSQHSCVSRLSPYLSRRILSPLEVCKKILEHHSPSESQFFLQEVCWQTYWRGWLEMRPNIWRELNDFEADQFKTVQYHKAVRGETSILCFNWWAGQLVATGYLHNHARLWFASIWIHTLQLPWQLGAEFFYKHLIDADPASNTLSWRWVAGIQTPGKSYMASKENIEKFTRGRFSPEGLADHAIPQVRDENLEITRTWQSLSTIFIDCDLVLIYPKNLHVFVDLVPAEAHIPKVVLADAIFNSSQSELVRSFDAEVARSLTKENKGLQTVGGVDDLIEFAKSKSLKKILCSRPPVGPEQDFHFNIKDRLRAESIELIEIRNEWDELLQPLAKKGFFQFKKSIGLIKDNGIFSLLCK